MPVKGIASQNPKIPNLVKFGAVNGDIFWFPTNKHLTNVLAGHNMTSACYVLRILHYTLLDVGAAVRLVCCGFRMPTGPIARGWQFEHESLNQRRGWLSPVRQILHYVVYVVSNPWQSLILATALTVTGEDNPNVVS